MVLASETKRPAMFFFFFLSGSGSVSGVASALGLVMISLVRFRTPVFVREFGC